MKRWYNLHIFHPFPPYIAIWCFALICIVNTPLKAQTNPLKHPINLSLQNITIGNALDSISGKIDMYFTYNATLINEAKIISIQTNGETLKKVLHTILGDTTLTFHVLKKQIIISQYQDTFPLNYYSDAEKHLILISGKIFDVKTGKPLPYANLGILGKLKGTTTNANGTFNLHISKKELGDTLKVSYIGYKNAFLILSDTLLSHYEIGLHPDFISLQEVIIRTSDPLSLIKSVLRNIPENYMQKPANYSAFYREWVKKNKGYMIYLESILDIYKSSYAVSSVEKDYARIVNSRKIFDASILDTISFRLQGGIEGCLLLDVVKNKPDFLQEKLFPFYNFKLEHMDTYNEQPVYVIKCTPKAHIKDPLLEGRLYIDTRNMAIIRVEFQYPKRIAGKLSSQFITKKSAHTKAIPTLLSYTVNYRYLNGKCYLSHSMGHLKFKVKNSRKLFSNTFETKFELATTHVETNKVHKIRWKDRVATNIILSKKIMEYDATFWGDNNFIEPEEDIQDALMRLQNKGL